MLALVFILPKTEDPLNSLTDPDSIQTLEKYGFESDPPKMNPDPDPSQFKTITFMAPNFRNNFKCRIGPKIRNQLEPSFASKSKKYFFFTLIGVIRVIVFSEFSLFLIVFKI